MIHFRLPTRPLITPLTVSLVNYSIAAPSIQPFTRYCIIAVPGTPYLESSGQIIYFVTPILAPGAHTIDVKVSAANFTNYYVLDRIEVAFENTSVASSTPNVDPGSSAHSASVSATVGGAVGGVAGAVVLVIIYLLLKKRKRGGQLNSLEGYGMTGVPIGRSA